MLFIQISFTTLLLFVAHVSTAPLHEPAARVGMHADHTAPIDGLSPALHAHGAKKQPLAGLAVAQVAPGAPAFADAASHMQVHAGNPLENPDDYAPRLRYARSPATVADVQLAHRQAIAAHYTAATAHHNAAANLWGSDYNRAEWHTAKAEKHEETVHDHERRIKELADRKHPIRGTAANNEIKEVNKQTAAAHVAAAAVHAAAAHQVPLS